MLPLNAAPAETPFDDEDVILFDDDPTLEHALRLWHQGIELQGDDTVWGVCEYGSIVCEDNAGYRAIWIKSIRQSEAAGLFDADTANALVHHMIAMHFDNIYNLDDPRQERISDAMFELCQRHGLEEGTDFTGHPNPPAEWTALVQEGEAMDELQWREILLENGESALWEMRSTRRADYDALIARVDARLEAEHNAARRARYGPEWDARWGLSRPS